MLRKIGVVGLAILLPLVASVSGWCDGTRLAPGDVISVTVDGEQDLSKQFQIDNNGMVDLPMIDPVKIAGMTATEAAAELTKALAKVLVNPQVSVTYVERMKMQVFVVGQVRKPGLTEVGIGDRVIHALAQAGYDETSDLARISVKRGDQSIPLDLTRYLSAEDLSVNIELRSGDTIVVPRLDSVGTVLVLGQLHKTGSVPITRNMTFRELMGLIGDVRVEADTEKITIKRTSVPEPIRVDYKRAMDGDPTADVVLQPGDTIYVPELETAFFTVIGGVNRAGQYPLKGKLTLTEAIGLAGGHAPNLGDMRKVRLVRSGEDGKPGQTMTIDATKIMAGSAEDPIIKRGDVIEVAVHKPKTSLWTIFTTLLPLGWLFK